MKLRVLLQYSPVTSSSHCPLFLFSSILNTPINYNKFSFLHFSSSVTSSSVTSSSPINNPNPSSIDFLIKTLGFSKTQADSVSKRFGSRKTPPKPDTVVHLLQQFGFSETQIRKAILVSPKILFADVEKSLEPKLSLFQNELGLTGPHLAHFVSTNLNILFVSLERRLIPNISILKKFIPEVENNKQCKEKGQVIPLKCSGFLGTDPKTLLNNVSFLQSCGIVGSQFSNFFKRDLLLFSRCESAVKDLVLKAQEMGFSCDSRMLVHAVSVLNRLSSKDIESKFKLLRSFGFSQEECSSMFRRAPALLGPSEENLKLKIDFFDGAGFERKMLVQNPTCLMYSLEKRVIPRFRVYQILKSKQQQLLLNKKCPSFATLVNLSEKRFLEKYVFKFGDNAKELLAAYENSSSE